MEFQEPKTKLAEQLAKAQNVNDKIHALVIFARSAIEAIEELQRRVTAQEQALGDLREQLAKTPRRAKTGPDLVSTQSLAQMAGTTANIEQTYVVKHIARKYSEEHKLEVKRGEGKSGQDWFTREAAEYAVNQFKKL